MDGEENHGRDSRDRERRRRKKVHGDVEEKSRNVASSERSSERSRRSGQTRPRDMTRTKSKESQKSTRSKSRENTTSRKIKPREKSREKPREISKSKSRERPSHDQDNQKDKSITRRKRVSGRRPRTTERTSGSNLEVITVCGRQFRTKPEVAKKSQKSKTKKVCDNDTLKNGEPGRRNIHDRIKGLQDQSQVLLEFIHESFDMIHIIRYI